MLGYKSYMENLIHSKPSYLGCTNYKLLTLWGTVTYTGPVNYHRENILIPTTSITYISIKLSKYNILVAQSLVLSS